MDSEIISGRRRRHAREIEDTANRAASGFDAMGVGTGDAVAFMLRNDFPIFEVTEACARLGAYPVPVNWHLKGEELRFILEDCGTRVLVIHADLLTGVAADLPPRVNVLVVETPEEIAAAYGIDATACAVPAGATAWAEWIGRQPPWNQLPRPAPMSMMYTSGTTGLPKGVRKMPPTPEQAECNTRWSRIIYGHRPGMHALVTAPIYHAAPNSGAIMAYRAGGQIVLMPRFAADQCRQLIQDHKITHAFMVPVMFVRLLKLPAEVRKRYDVSSLEHVVHAGAPCPAAVKEAMIEWWGPVLWEYYGSTETSAITCCSSDEWRRKSGTVGRIIEPALVKILDSSGTEVPLGEPGEIYCRRTDLPDFTYHGLPEKRAEVERDGLITNGDVGFVDADGYLYLCDRTKDMIISGGVNIYPAEIEAVLLEVEGVSDCAVFGIPDDEFGEAVAAAVQPQPGAHLDPAAIRNMLKRRLAGYKVPRVIDVHDMLPREDTGKIFKRRLRDPYWERAGRRI